MGNRELNEIITKISRAVAPGMTNPGSRLFGGALLSWMDEVSGITAARRTQSNVVTVAIENVQFKKPILLGEFVDVEGAVLSLGRTSLRISVTVWADRKDSLREEVANAVFVYVKVDGDGIPQQIMEVKCF